VQPPFALLEKEKRVKGPQRALYLRQFLKGKREMKDPPASVFSAPGEGAVVAAQQPAHSPRSGRFEGGGRRLVSSTGGGDQQQQQSPRSAVKRSPRVQTMEDMDKRIAQDALTLINMKREIVESQKAEVVKAQSLLAAIRKEHDTLHVSNERLLSQINSILAKANSLETVDKGVKASGNATQDMANSFRKQIEEADEMNTAEQRTLRMQQLMVSRLDLEIAELRALSAKATFKLDTLRHELVSTESTLMLSKQERGTQEHKFNEMRRTIDGLTKERNNKIHMMQSIIDDGEMSLSRVQGSVFDTLKSPRARSSASRTTTRTGESPIRTEEQEDFELSTAVDARPEVLAKRLSVNRVREMVARYNTRASRMEKLERLEGELRHRVAAEKARQVELQEQLDDVRVRHHTIASSRTKMYKDMDDKANALWKAKKTCDDWQEREQRLRGNIQAIQRAVPRLLSKLTKAFVAVPTVEDVSTQPTGGVIFSLHH
jgi:chromosome segregation ATPase